MAMYLSSVFTAVQYSKLDIDDTISMESITFCQSILTTATRRRGVNKCRILRPSPKHALECFPIVENDRTGQATKHPDNKTTVQIVGAVE